MNIDPYKCYNEREAASFLGVSRKTLSRRRKAGEIAFINSSPITYRRSDLIAYQEANRVTQQLTQSTDLTWST